MPLSKAKIAGLFLACFASWDAGACNLEKAVYRPKESPAEATLSFEKSGAPSPFSDLIATVRSERTGRSYPLSFVVSNGYGLTQLVTSDSGNSKDKKDAPYSSISSLIFFFDEHLNGDYASMSNDRAPLYLFMPELGVSLYYGGDATIRNREEIPTEMWMLSACR